MLTAGTLIMVLDVVLHDFELNVVEQVEAKRPRLCVLTANECLARCAMQIMDIGVWVWTPLHWVDFLFAGRSRR